MSARLGAAARSTALRLGRSAPLPAGGATEDRWRLLSDVGREDLQLGRLVEPHLDAVAILAEAQVAEDPGRWFAVWASAPRPELVRDGGSFVLDGTQAFCSGASLCDAALVAAEMDDAVVLVRVDVARGRADGSIVVDGSAWRTSAFSETGTATIAFDELRVCSTDLIGDEDFYLERAGFWHGAVGPAAVWAGGAAGLVEVAERHTTTSGAGRALLGELRSLAWAMEAQLAAAGREADRHPGDVDAARRRALVVRNLVERQCTATIDLFGQLCGPRALALDDGAARRVQELSLYIRQVHRAEDLEELGRPEAG